MLYSKVNGIIQRFNDADEKTQDKLKILLIRYVENYAFLSFVVTYDDIKLEKLFVVAKFLKNGNLLRGIGFADPDLKGDLSLQYYRLEKTHEGDISLDEGQRPLKLTESSATVKTPDVMTTLSEIINAINEIFAENNLSHLIVTAKETGNPFHLNDIQPVLTDGSFWKKGDLFLSLRNLSMIMLYRPSTNKVLWHQQGPWIYQHDVDIMSENDLSIFISRLYVQGILAEFNEPIGCDAIAPNTAVPTVDPRLLKSWLELVATPRSFCSNSLCTARVNTGIATPIPIPSSTIIVAS